MGAWSCGMANSTSIGEIWVISATPLTSLVPTTLPTSTVRRPTRPPIGRHDAGIAQVQPCRALVGLGYHHGRLELLDQRGLRIDFLARDGVLLQQGTKALQRDARYFQLRLVAHALARGLLQRHLELAGIDDGQHFALAHHLAFLVEDLLQHAPDLGPHPHGGLRHDGAQRVDDDGDIDALGWGDADGRGRAPAAACSAPPGRAPAPVRPPSATAGDCGWVSSQASQPMPPTTRMAMRLPMRVARRLMRRRGGSASARGACESYGGCGSMDLLVGAEAHPDPQGNASGPWSLIVMPLPGCAWRRVGKSLAKRRRLGLRRAVRAVIPGLTRDPRWRGNALTAGFPRCILASRQAVPGRGSYCGGLRFAPTPLRCSAWGRRRTTHCAPRGRSVQTGATSQLTKRASAPAPRPSIAAATEIAPAGYRLPRGDVVGVPATSANGVCAKSGVHTEHVDEHRPSARPLREAEPRRVSAAYDGPTRTASDRSKRLIHQFSCCRPET